MGVSASLTPRALTVEAGASARCEVKVRNTGTVVDQFVVDVVGDAARFAQAEPSSMNLLPGDEATAVVTFAPPRAHGTPAGDVAFGVRVFSREDPAGSTVEEGVITIGPFSEIGSEIVPRTSRGRRKARYEVAVDNRGNVPVSTELLGTDPDQLMRFEINPSMITCEPGTATFARVTTKPKGSFWRGPPKTIPFQVTAVPQGAAPVTADGAMVQEAMLPRWLPALLAALVVAAIVLTVLYFTVFKPVIKDAARDEAKKTLATATLAANAATKKADQAAVSAAAAKKAVEGAGIKVPGATTTTVPSLTSLIAGGNGVSFRLDGGPVNAGQTKTTGAPPAPAGKTLFLTDLVLENPQGDTGTITVRRGTGAGGVLFQIGLGNFRDLDYHFVAPLMFRPGGASDLEIDVACTTPGGTPPAPSCDPAAVVSGVYGQLP